MEKVKIEVGTKMCWDGDDEFTVTFITDDDYYALLEYPDGSKDILHMESIYDFIADGELSIVKQKEKNILNKEKLQKIESEHKTNEKAMYEYIVEMINNSGGYIEFDDSVTLKERDCESWYLAIGLYKEEDKYYTKVGIEHHYSIGIEEEESMILHDLGFDELLSISLYLANQ